MADDLHPFWESVFVDKAALEQQVRQYAPQGLQYGDRVLSVDTLVGLVNDTPTSPWGVGLYSGVTWDRSHPFTQQHGWDFFQLAAAGASRALQFRTSDWTQSAMAPIVIPNVYRVSIEAFCGGQEVVNVIGLRGSGSGLELAAAQATQTAWKVASGPITRVNGLYQLSGFRSMDLSSLNGGIAFVPDTQGGTNTATQIATNGAAALVKWNGGTRSRSSRGRMYAGPLVEGDINADGRTLSATAVTAWNNAFNAFRTSLSSNGFTLCVISRTLSQAYDVSTSGVEATIATQRRRIRG
jgi:hypothetical protein